MSIETAVIILGAWTALLNLFWAIRLDKENKRLYETLDRLFDFIADRADSLR
jgi:hypothetical protein